MSTLAITFEHVTEPTQIADSDGNLWLNPNGTVTLGGLGMVMVFRLRE